MQRDTYNPTNFRCGFRFKRDQRRILEHIATQNEVFGKHDAVTLFRSASVAASTGEPMIVAADSLEEAKQLAAAFGRVPGVLTPAIEQLSPV